MPEHLNMPTSPRDVRHFIDSVKEDIDPKFRRILDIISESGEHQLAKNIINQYQHHLNILYDELQRERTSSGYLTSLAIKYLIITKNLLIEIRESSDRVSPERIGDLLGLVGSYISELSQESIAKFEIEFERLEKYKIEFSKEIDMLKEKQNSFILITERSEARLTELDRNITAIFTANNNLDKLVQEAMSAIHNEFDTTVAHLAQKKQEVDDVVGLIAGKSVAGSYEISAKEERSVANWLRGFAIFFMILIVSLIGYTLIESTKPVFSIELAILRIAFALILSVPAAYLARESAKHRQQQYTHLQTSLDLKAISPYIASLPPETQNKLKEEMASRIFSQKNFDHITKETYPINTQELAIALIEKIGNKEKTKVESNDG